MLALPISTTSMSAWRSSVVFTSRVVFCIGMGAVGVVRLPIDVMKPIHIVLSLLLIACAILVWLSTRSDPAVAEPGVLQPLEETILQAEPSPSPEASRLIDTPVAAEEPKRPVQPLEERGDAMLFEVDALQGTPFGQAVVMPFE